MNNNKYWTADVERKRREARARSGTVFGLDWIQPVCLADAVPGSAVLFEN